MSESNHALAHIHLQTVKWETVYVLARADVLLLTQHSLHTTSLAPAENEQLALVNEDGLSPKPERESKG